MRERPLFLPPMECRGGGAREWSISTETKQEGSVRKTFGSRTVTAAAARGLGGLKRLTSATGPSCQREHNPT